MSKIGYACINETLRSNKPQIFTGRSMRKTTFQSRGLQYASELAEQNVRDLLKILTWNIQNEIYFMRIGSDMFPWMSTYEFKDLPNYKTIVKVLKECGEIAQKHNIRLTFHPGPFNVLGSPKQEVVDKTVRELNQHSQIFDIMGLESSPYNKINIHVGGTYGDKKQTLNRFIQNFKLLDSNTQKRLTVENDDKASMYSVSDLMYLYDKIKIPIVFDYHHHFCYGDKMPEGEALGLCIKTWPPRITPIVHYSESKSQHESNSKIKIQAHSDYIRQLPNTYGYDVDVMIECKKKELAILRLLKTLI